jgi:signal transduction histidine kinase/CheY-like chemotaxis protein
MTEQRYSASVLVVDDEPGIVRLCQRLLERSGFRVQTVLNPNEGLAVLGADSVDLLLVDIRMPEMDGFSLIDQARLQQPELAVVVMTGFGTVETAIEALRRGADGLILKPFAGADLVKTVQRAIQESRQKQDVLRLQTLRPLFAITEALFAETNPERLKTLLLEAITGNLSCSHTGLYTQGEEKHFCLVAGRDAPPFADDAAGQALLERAYQWGAPMLEKGECSGEPELQALLLRHNLCSVMAAPLRTPVALQDSTLLLIAGRSQSEAPFRESDLEIFAILVRQAAVALENARLHAELKAYIRQVEESQRALVQAEKMAIAGRLTASIAHEINNPLQSVQNCLHLAGRQELAPEQRNSYLTTAQSELERLMNTVQRMLDYYRPAAVDRKPVDINVILERVMLLLERQLAEHKIQLKTRLASRMPPVMAVGDQVQQVLLNLLLNAMEAMPEGGRLFVETRSRNGGVEVLVEDTGPGVQQGQRERIFEPFVSTKEGGTGLGLAVSYGIIAAHGGSLDLIDGRGRGACFRISLPAEGTT